MSCKSRGRYGGNTFLYGTGTRQQLNPVHSDPQLAGIFEKKPEIFSKPEFLAKHNSTMNPSSSPTLRVTSKDLYENLNFDNKNANNNKTHTNKYSQVVSDLKMTLKQRRKPAPKPPTKLPQMHQHHSLRGYDVNDGLRKSQISSVYERHYDRPESDCTEKYSSDSISIDNHVNCDEKYDASGVYENVEINQINVPDDIKVKMSDIYGYIEMQPKIIKRRKSASDLLDNGNNTRIRSTVHIKKNLNVYKSNTNSWHDKGVQGCFFAPRDSYIYSINPSCVTGNAPPFVKTKEKRDPLPCFCSKNASGTQKIPENEVFFSCEDIYVNVGRMDECDDSPIEADSTVEPDNPVFKDFENSTSIEDDSISFIVERFDNRDNCNGVLWKKKWHQFKNFVTDW